MDLNGHIAEQIFLLEILKDNVYKESTTQKTDSDINSNITSFFLYFNINLLFEIDNE